LYALDEKERACVLLENFLNEEIVETSIQSRKIKKERIAEIKRKLSSLKKSQDSEKIKNLSKDMTKLYQKATSSKLVNDDISDESFNIKYFKSGNSLQTFHNEEILEDNIKKIVEVSYSQGSMARHTLIQLTGYLAFLKLLLAENKYPLIPILVIDHISKPFDDNNRKGIGEILNYAISEIGECNLQIILFDDKKYEELSLQPHKSEDLVNEEKTGFIPFYIPIHNDKTDENNTNESKTN
jgi:hypothetical protein